MLVIVLTQMLHLMLKQPLLNYLTQQQIVTFITMMMMINKNIVEMTLTMLLLLLDMKLLLLGMNTGLSKTHGAINGATTAFSKSSKAKVIVLLDTIEILCHF